MYSPAVLERVRDPKYVGWLPRDAPDVGTGEAGTLERGTVMRIQVRIDRTARRIDEAVFKVFGCSAAIASASLVTERLQGATVGRRASDGAAGDCRGAGAADRARAAWRRWRWRRHRRAIEDWETTKR